MKIALFQPSVSPGNFEENSRKLVQFCHACARENCDLILTPAESLFGPENLEMHPHEKEISSMLNNMAEQIHGPALVCAFPNSGWNYVLVSHGMAVRIDGEVVIHNRRFLIPGKLPEKLASGNLPYFRINCVSSPWHIRKYPAYEEHLMREASMAKSWIFSCSIAGGYGSHVYDGNTLVINPYGNILARASKFREDAIFFETGKEWEALPPDVYSQEYLWEALVTGTRDYVLNAGADSVVIGLSGGMDSAMVACIAREALGAEKVLGVMMPSPYSSASSLEDASQLAQNLGIQTTIIPIDRIKKAFEKTLSKSGLPISPLSLPEENLQARIRGTLLMTISNQTGALVLNTGNKSEAITGYCTLHGDAVGALSVIGDLYKTGVYDLARWYNQNRDRKIPENILLKAPSAELRPNQKDEDSLPAYEDLDKCLAWLLNESDEDCSSYDRLDEIRRKMEVSSFKRKLLPPALMVGVTRR